MRKWLILLALLSFFNISYAECKARLLFMQQPLFLNREFVQIVLQDDDSADAVDNFHPFFS